MSHPSSQPPLGADHLELAEQFFSERPFDGEVLTDWDESRLDALKRFGNSNIEIESVCCRIEREKSAVIKKMVEDGFPEVPTLGSGGNAVTLSPPAKVAPIKKGKSRIAKPVPIPDPDDNPLPVWNEDLGELSYKGEIVRTLVSRAKNCRAVLTAFQDQKWTNPIKDPLKGSKDEQRVWDTVKSLNKKLRALQFASGGDAESFTWKLAEE